MFNDYYGDYGYYRYGQTPGAYNYAFSGFFSGVAAFLMVLLLLYIFIVYIFQSIGLYHMAKDRGIAHAWFAWVPILSDYILGRLINNKVVLGDSIVLGHAEFFLPLAALISAVATGYGLGGFWPMLILALSFVYQVSGLWRLYKIYRPKNRTSYTIWSVILGPGFFIYAIRNDRPYDPLEPDKVYQNFYAGKHRIDQSFDRKEEELKEQEKERRSALRDEYERDIHKEGLSISQKEEIRKQYHENRDNLEDTFEDFLIEERKERRDEINALDQEVQTEAQESNETDIEPKPEIEIDSFEIEFQPSERNIYEEADGFLTYTEEGIESIPQEKSLDDETEINLIDVDLNDDFFNNNENNS